MKHLFFALSIALLSSSAATTAWSQQTNPPAWIQQTTQTEQAIKGFIVNTMNHNCDVRDVQFDGSTFHLQDDNWDVLIPVHRLYQAEVINHYSSLQFQCRQAEDACISDNDNWDSNNYSEVITNACLSNHDNTNVVLEQAFNHLIGIYDTRRFVSTLP